VNNTAPGKQRSLRALEWLNFFLADVQTGLGPFLAAYLASSGWNPSSVGYVLTFGGLVGVAMQTPAGAVIDAVHRKRTLLGVNLGFLVAGAFRLMGHLSPWRAYSAQFLIGSSGPFLGPTVAAITLGIVGAASLHFLDSGLLGALLGASAERVAKDRSIFGPLLETFVFSEVLKQASGFGESCALYHYRDKDQDEVDLVIEAGSGALVGIEVKASATVNAADFRGLRKLAKACGENFKLGVVLYDGGRPVPFGDRLVAAPMSCLWA
jgi:MFS family permease